MDEQHQMDYFHLLSNRPVFLEITPSYSGAQCKQ